MRELFLVLLSLSAGLAVGGAFAAFITLLNLVARLVQVTETKKHIKVYEWTITISSFISIILYFSEFDFGLSSTFTSFIGFGMGIFIGLFSSSLAEVLNVIPLISKKFKVKKELKYIVYSLLLGKVMGSLYFWIFY
ncbi:stage V sporulation protein AB [Tissierella creatinophila]|uniref:Stage V sporulation protein AB n=1 Tax=Tissierella creatinophila DSM 6911 TaxID=1123403 RepID=A0A1U7M6B6_TISCR|nr:stage V sporulation protein AB [Tissierella creatinophila]OLS02862.1 hypothetical protein TICRE_11350 [Tissierella creatinophila DSM 6911]